MSARTNPLGGDCRAAVLEELRSIQALNESALEVIADGDAVWLRGTVDCEAKRRIAEDAARAVACVRTVVSEIEVVNSQFTRLRDFELNRLAAHAIHWHYALSKRSITLGVSNGVVYLEGQVASLHERREADRVLALLPDIHGIDNRLEVRCQKLPPHEMEARVRALVRRRLGDWAGVEVSANAHGVVTLHGHVASWAEKAALLGAIGHLASVTAIQDMLDIERPVTAAPAPAKTLTA